MLHNHELTSQFLIDPNITFLNFGSFGACPKPVMEQYQRLQMEQERDPVAFFADKGPNALKDVRSKLSNYINCNPDDVVCVSNPTYAVNIIAKNFQLNKGDEILSTDLEYGACSKTWEYYCEKAGATFIKTKIDLPLSNEIAIINALEARITPNTKLIFISHITSVTALIMPVYSVVALGKKYNIPVFIDGAHAPGHIPLNITALDCAYFTGACHKWMLAPKGTSFLYVKKEYQAALDPIAISWGYKSTFSSGSILIDNHELQGTRDICGFLTIPAAIDFMHENNWQQVREECKDLVLHNAPTFASLLETELLAPLSKQFLGQMCSCAIKTKDAMQLHFELYNRFKIQIPIPIEQEKTYIRFSINAFNTQKNLDHLFEAIDTLKKENKILPA